MRFFLQYGDVYLISHLSTVQSNYLHTFFNAYVCFSLVCAAETAERDEAGGSGVTRTICSFTTSLRHYTADILVGGIH